MTRIKEKTKEYWDRFIEHVERRHPVYVAFSGIAVAAFTLALFIATWLLWTAGEKHSERQLRAYVGIGAPHFGERDPRELTITVQNGGQTPAYKVWVHLNRYWVPFGQKLPANFAYPDYNPGDKRSAAVVQSGKEITFTFEFDPNELARVRNQETAFVSVWPRRLHRRFRQKSFFSVLLSISPGYEGREGYWPSTHLSVRA